jgi:hypothetical protein
MKDEVLAMYNVSKQYCICWNTLKDYIHRSFWSILTADIAKLLLRPPYMVKSFVGFGSIANQRR